MLQILKKYKYDILICALILIISIIENIHMYFDPYWGGLKNLAGSGPFLEILFYHPLKLCIIFCAVLRIIFCFKSKQKLPSYIFTILFCIIISIVSFILSFNIGQPNAVRFLNGYEKWTKENIEIDKIQQWLISGEADKYMGNVYSNSFSDIPIPEDLPDFMNIFKQQYIFFNDQKSDRGKSIESCQGNALVGHWGIVIGLPNSNAQQDGIIKEYDSYWEYRRSIKPGVYIYYGG